MKKLVLVMFLWTSSSFLMVSHAGQWGVGGQVGQSSFDISKGNCNGLCDIDDSDTSIGANISYDFSKHWGAEAGYMDFGSTSVNAQVGIYSFTADVDAAAAYLVGTGTYYFNDHISITGRAGAGSLKAKASALSTGFSDSSEELFLGASVDYHFNDAMALGLRYDTIDDVNAISLGFKYKFGSK